MGFGERYASQHNKNPKLFYNDTGDKNGFSRPSLNTVTEIQEIHSASTSSTICEVLDIEDKKWRFVSTAALDHHYILHSQRPAFANGSFYWLTGDEEGYLTTQTKLIVFDIHMEMFQVTETPPFVTRDTCGDKIGVCNLDGRLCVSELKADCKQEFSWRVKDQLWEKILSVDLNSTSTWFGGVTSQPLTPLAILKDDKKVILSLSYHDNLVSFDLDPHSTVYHLYLSCYYAKSSRTESKIQRSNVTSGIRAKVAVSRSSPQVLIRISTRSKIVKPENQASKKKDQVKNLQDRSVALVDKVRCFPKLHGDLQFSDCILQA
ncbi:hypothetical protein BRARA_I02051 [Brassica rapa]|uniref:F-box associated beta-propeller type 1 domain-containing protein n=1 Tax=Brassica campestris TaxID=3711 RepID=A0A397XVA9_BRACM|nr:hypothetical protein BRARA_I02051 [Brassica rapa]